MQRREQAVLRPVLVLSHQLFDKRCETVIVAVTSKPQRAGFPLTIGLPGGALPKPSWLTISQIRTISVDRLGKRIAVLESEVLTSALGRGYFQEGWLRYAGSLRRSQLKHDERAYPVGGLVCRRGDANPAPVRLPPPPPACGRIPPVDRNSCDNTLTDAGVQIRLTPLREAETGKIRPYLVLLLSAVLLVLLIGCVNSANLLAGESRRARERDRHADRSRLRRVATRATDAHRKRCARAGSRMRVSLGRF